MSTYGSDGRRMYPEGEGEVSCPVCASVVPAGHLLGKTLRSRVWALGLRHGAEQGALYALESTSDALWALGCGVLAKAYKHDVDPNLDSSMYAEDLIALGVPFGWDEGATPAEEETRFSALNEAAGEYERAFEEGWISAVRDRAAHMLAP